MRCIAAVSVLSLVAWPGAVSGLFNTALPPPWCSWPPPADDYVPRGPMPPMPPCPNLSWCFDVDVMLPMAQEIRASCGTAAPATMAACNSDFACILTVISRMDKIISRPPPSYQTRASSEEKADRWTKVLGRMVMHFTPAAQPWARSVLATEYERSGSMLDGAFYGRYVAALKSICTYDMNNVKLPCCESTSSARRS